MISGTVQRSALPPEIESPRAKLVYLYLSWQGEASIAELEADLGMKKLTLYGVLGPLCSRELVEQDGENYVIS